MHYENTLLSLSLVRLHGLHRSSSGTHAFGIETQFANPMPPSLPNSSVSIRFLALFRWLPYTLSTKELLLWRGNMGRDEDYCYDYRTSKLGWRRQPDEASLLAVFVRHHFDLAILTRLMKDWSSWVSKVRGAIIDSLACLAI